MKVDINTYCEKRPRAIQGKAFQSRVQAALEKRFSDVEDTREKFAKQDPELNDFQLACLEKEWGDITFTVGQQRIWVECCYVMGEIGNICDLKREKFVGKNRWYCLGRIDQPETMVFIPSLVFNKYLSKLENKRRGRRLFRQFRRAMVGSKFKSGVIGVQCFARTINNR
tara:strand:- start:152 stop:658 length:507 start_codon:yes stop_codon:yes gene_type:complete